MTDTRINRLTDREVIRITKPGMHPDGDGLYLQVSASAKRSPSKSWIFRYKGIDGKEHKPGLGSLITIDLVEVREKAKRCRRWLLDGIDPIECLRAFRKPKDGRTFDDVIFTFLKHEEVEKGWIKRYAIRQYLI